MTDPAPRPDPPAQPDAPAPGGEWISGFDGLRALAVGLVVGHHLYWDGQYGGRLWWPLGVLLEMGTVGVDLFFVLSGFLITGLLVRSRGQERYWSRFAIRRALRILPAYFLFFGVVGLRLWGHPGAPGEVVPWWAYLTFLQNWWMGLGFDRPGDADPTWSLAIEEQFYLLWPLVVWLLPVRWLVRVLCGVVLLVPVFRWWVWERHGTDAVYFWTLCRMDTLVVGALAWLLWERGPEWGRRLAVAAAGPMFASVALGALAGGFDRTWGPFVVFGYTWVALAGAAVLLAVRSGRWRWLSRALAWRPLEAVGKVSYGLYLWHRFAVGAVATLVGATLGVPSGSWEASVVYLGGSLGFAGLLTWASWRYWESPWLSLKDRLAP